MPRRWPGIGPSIICEDVSTPVLGAKGLPRTTRRVDVTPSFDLMGRTAFTHNLSMLHAGHALRDQLFTDKLSITVTPGGYLIDIPVPYLRLVSIIGGDCIYFHRLMDEDGHEKLKLSIDIVAVDGQLAIVYVPSLP
ncbi:hypothetical protein PHLGIDRAFT_117216 [Phlebiopsis gigantea 11061_1 CR5-6]|uniref:Uncharacterized protein n=1 Tax=Phlebiopsis gigantea (strain 11061_1 CR5-6) TaxID=745531 RepID=A0A0C3PNQ1_PHLG1|nr:hypothetical protein PHLGIDRAFT_117216 [Phlebiopsis gigantea 11061_1 CR5-6]